MEYFNKLLRKTNNKKTEAVEASPKCNQTFTHESNVDPDLVPSRNSTPKKLHDSGDTESDTTAEYESAGESSPWGKEPNLSALADSLAGVHLSTPNKKNPSKLNHFPFSPISAEDETDDEVTAIISNNSHNSVPGSLSLMEEEISPKSNTYSDGKNTPFVVISPSQVLAKVDNNNQGKIIDGQTCSEIGKSDSFRVITDSPGVIQRSSVTEVVDHTSSLKIEGTDKENVISPTVEFQDAGPACSFHSEVMNSIGPQLHSGTLNSSLISNSSLIIEECRHSDSIQSLDIKGDQLSVINADEHENKEINIRDTQQIESKCVFSQNSTNKSENVSKFVNEKHPVCLAEPLQTVDLANSLESVDKASVGLKGPPANIGTNEKNPGNISISEMCNLIETTFNSSLKENLNEICENITSTNLKPSLLLGKDEVDILPVSVSDIIEQHDQDFRISKNTVTCLQKSSLDCIDHSLPSTPDNLDSKQGTGQINKQSISIETPYSSDSALTEQIIITDTSFSKKNSILLDTEKIEQISFTQDYPSLQDSNSVKSLSLSTILDPDQLNSTIAYDSSNDLKLLAKNVVHEVSELNNIIENSHFRNSESVVCEVVENKNLSQDVSVLVGQKIEEPSITLQQSIVLETNDHLLDTSKSSFLEEAHEIIGLNNSQKTIQKNNALQQDEITATLAGGREVTVEENVETTNIPNLVLDSGNNDVITSNLLPSPTHDDHYMSTDISQNENIVLSEHRVVGEESLSILPATIKLEEIKATNQQPLLDANIQEALKFSPVIASVDNSIPTTENGSNLPTNPEDCHTSVLKNSFETSCHENPPLNEGEVVKDDSSGQKIDEKKVEATSIGKIIEERNLCLKDDPFLDTKIEEPSSKIENPPLNSDIEGALRISSTLQSDDHFVSSTLNESNSSNMDNSVETSIGKIVEDGNLSLKNSSILDTKKIEKPASKIENPPLNSDIEGTISSSSTISDLISKDNMSDLRSSTEISHVCNSLINEGKIIEDKSYSQAEICIDDTKKIKEILANIEKPALNSNIEGTLSSSSALGSASVLGDVNNSNISTQAAYFTNEGASTKIQQPLQETEIIGDLVLSPLSDSGTSTNLTNIPSEVCPEISIASNVNEVETKTSISSSILNVDKCTEPNSAIPHEYKMELVESLQGSLKTESQETFVKTSTVSFNSSSCNNSKEMVNTNTIESKVIVHEPTSSLFNSKEKAFKQTMSASDLLNDIKKCMTMNVDECINQNKELETASGNCTEKSSLENEELSKVIKGIDNMKLISSEGNDRLKSCEMSQTYNIDHTSIKNKENMCFSENYDGTGVLISHDSMKSVESTGNSSCIRPSVAPERTMKKTSILTSAENTIKEEETRDFVNDSQISKEKINSLESANRQPPNSTAGKMATENEVDAPLSETKALSESPVNESVTSPKKNFPQGVSKVDKLNKSTPERKSYEDLLDKCLQQEKLLGFDNSFKEEANKIVEELENSTDCANSTEPESSGLPSPKVNISEAGPITADEDANKEIFQDASNFDFEYLSKIRGKPGQRKLIRESLFLKFDPLASSSNPDQEPIMEEKYRPHPDSSDAMVTPPRAPQTAEEQLVSITPLAVHSTSPATSNTPRIRGRSSSTSTTPSMRQEFLSKEISKLQDLMIKQEFSYQEQITACLDEIEDLKQKLAEVEEQESHRELEEKLALAVTEREELKKKLETAENDKAELFIIVEEYDVTLNKIIKKKEEETKQFEAKVESITLERDEHIQHLRNMELAFNDIHQKYERSKEAISVLKENEAKLKWSISENEKCIKHQKESYQKLKEHASQKLEEANNEITEMKKAHQLEIAKLGAINRKLEIQVKSLEESLEQKKIEVAELTKVCDDLITKYK